MPYLRECVESVLSQDFQDWEMLISDDGSKDESIAYLNTLTDTRIRVFRQEKNLGIFGNLNFLFRQAKAPLSQILCQDDYLTAGDSLSRIMAIWNKLPSDIGFLRCNWGKTDAQSPANKLECETLPETINSAQGTLFFFVFGNIPGNLSNVSVRTLSIRDAGWFRTDLPYAGDFEFWSRLILQHSMALNKDNFVHVRRHPGVASIHLNRQGELVSQIHKVVEVFFHRLKVQIPPALLRLYFTVNYDTLQRDAGVTRLLKGRGLHYLQQVEKNGNASAITLGWPSRWIIYLLTGGGRWGRNTVGRWVLNRGTIKQ